MRPFNQKEYASLAKATHAGDLSAVKKMLELGEDPNSYDSEYEAYALHLAISRLSWETSDHKKDTEIIRLLVNHGANVNIPLHGRMPLWVAEAGNHVDIVNILLMAGAKRHSEEKKTSIAPAKERVIRKVASDYAYQLRRIRPDYNEEQLVEAIQNKIVIQPEPNTSSDDYMKFKEEMRLVICDVVGIR